jgi:hypothetical protein
MLDWYAYALEKLMREEEQSRQSGKGENKDDGEKTHEAALIREAQFAYSLTPRKGLYKTAALVDADLLERICKNALRLTLSLIKNSNAMLVDREVIRKTYITFFKTFEKSVTEPWNLQST